MNGSLWRNHSKLFYLYCRLKIKKVYLPSILADKCSKISMSFCIMDSLCHFLFVKYGQKARNCRSRVN